MISINGNSAIKQPNDINENPEQIQTDQMAVDGSMQRNRLGKKRRAVLKWNHLKPAEYQQLMTYFESGNAVTYSNDQSNVAGGVLTFTGLPTFDQGNYYRGTTLIVPLTVTIREV